MLIESHDRFADVAHYEPESGRLVELSRGEAAEQALAGPVRGHYARLGGELAVFYRSGGSLWLRIGEHALVLGEGAVVRWENSGERSRLSLLADGNEVAAVEYSSPLCDADLVNDPTPFAEAEDWDFGLFIESVLTEDVRRRRIYTDEPTVMTRPDLFCPDGDPPAPRIL